MGLKKHLFRAELNFSQKIVAGRSDQLSSLV